MWLLLKNSSCYSVHLLALLTPRTSLSNFARRYPWYPEFDETTKPAAAQSKAVAKPATKAPAKLATNAAAKATAKARLATAKKESKKRQSDPATQAEQDVDEDFEKVEMADWEEV